MAMRFYVFINLCLQAMIAGSTGCHVPDLCFRFRE